MRRQSDSTTSRKAPSHTAFRLVSFSHHFFQGVSSINIRVIATFLLPTEVLPASPSVYIPTLRLRNSISHEILFCWIDANVVYSADWWWALTEWSVSINDYRKNTLVHFHDEAYHLRLQYLSQFKLLERSNPLSLHSSHQKQTIPYPT